MLRSFATTNKKCVIASVSVAIPLKKYAAYTPYFTPRVDSPDETGEVARASATKGGRAVEPASSLRSLAKTVNNASGKYRVKK